MAKNLVNFNKLLKFDDIIKFHSLFSHMLTTLELTIRFGNLQRPKKRNIHQHILFDSFLLLELFISCISRFSYWKLSILKKKLFIVWKTWKFVNEFFLVTWNIIHRHLLVIQNSRQTICIWKNIKNIYFSLTIRLFFKIEKIRILINTNFSLEYKELHKTYTILWHWRNRFFKNRLPVLLIAFEIFNF